MARYSSARCKLCRREGEKLFLKGEKCFGSKCAFEKRAYPPGMHGKTKRRRPQGFGLQLREKQKAKAVYGVLERQFRRFFRTASKKKEATGEVLMSLLERRLDNVVQKLGFAPSRASARELISHGHFLVNGRKVDIPSYLLKPQDVIMLRERSKGISLIKASLDRTDPKVLPAWISLDKDTLQGTVERLPTREEITTPIQERLIVELYSK
ncbi:30S ribosomal protein S4 [candidate division TA06 bacterium DG_26]|uniref:Small ribosomal subunit protein uS4 n=1 Tax=candidate division TA06 bacterium DG_26 TaxID=1703771 RepID=A0A0S7WKT0_UNCT6|nr:MAG: 30S ribosomal protein S4 [candidate division TA06 bacterium DG_26]